MLDEKELRAYIRKFQQEEVDGAALYCQIAAKSKDGKNREILLKIAEDENRHAAILRNYSGEELRPNRLRLLLYTIIAVIAGYTFAIKLMERSEERTKARYRAFDKNEAEHARFWELAGIIRDEERHEVVLTSMLKEERIGYVGSIVLGMNDALVELTGALAGYTFAMQNTRIIAMAGIITGFSATFSMAASEFLSSRADGHHNALKSAIYTGVAYLITVLLLILPFLLFHREMYMWALLVALATAIAVIACFNWFIAVTLDRSFKKGLVEMSALSMGVAVLSFGIGILVKNFLGIDL